MKTNIKDIDSYIAFYPKDIQKLLQELRSIIQKAAPKAVEVISYGMPAFKQDGVLVYFAANKAHIGFYPTSSPIKVFKNELAKYKTSKGAIQFPFEMGIPTTLVKNIVKFRIVEDKERTLARVAKNKK